MSARHNRVVAELSSKVWASSDIDTILRTTLTELTNTLKASQGLIQLEISDHNGITEIDESVTT